MKKSINGLSILVEEQLELDPFSGHLFVFYNRKHDMVKVLYWGRTVFVSGISGLNVTGFSGPNWVKRFWALTIEN